VNAGKTTDYTLTCVSAAGKVSDPEGEVFTLEDLLGLMGAAGDAVIIERIEVGP
jgi:hypothetical protein